MNFARNTRGHSVVHDGKALSEIRHDFNEINPDIDIEEVPTELPDGLSDGIVSTSIQIVLDVKYMYPWTSHIPKNVFYEYVLPFALINEGRSNWRPLFHDALSPLMNELIESNSDEIRWNDSASIDKVYKVVNEKVWSMFGKNIYFKSGQTPLIYDPMSIIAFGYASCTGKIPNSSVQFFFRNERLKSF